MNIIERLNEVTGFIHQERGRVAAAACLSEEAAYRIKELENILTEFQSAMNILSSRVGLTVKDVADILNPIADQVRFVLEDK